MPTSIVLDLGATRVCCGIFSASRSGQLFLRRFATEPIERGPAPAGLHWIPSAAAALRSLAQREGLRGACRVSLPGEATLVRVVRTPLTGAPSILGAMGFEMQQNIPVPLDEVVWDHVPIQVVDGYCDAVLAAVRLATAESICRTLVSLGLTPMALEPAAFALVQAVRAQSALGRGAIVASIGARSTHLVFSADARFCLRTIGIGADFATLRLAESLGIGFDAASALTIRAVSDRSSAPAALHDAVEVLVGRLRGEIARFGGQLESILGIEAAGPAIAVTGRGAGLPGLINALRRTARVLPFDSMQCVRFADGLPDLGLGQIPAELVGLATALSDPARPSLNLLPRELARSNSWRRRQPAALAAAALTALAPLPAVGYFHSEAATLLEQAASEGRRAAAQAQLQDRRRELAAALGQTERETAELRRQLASRTVWVRLVEDLQARIAGTNGVWLETMHRVDADFFAIAIAGRGVTGAVSAEEIFDRLRASPYVGAIDDARTARSADGFSFSCVLRVEAPIP